MLQALADGLTTGAIVALGAVGLTLTMGILRFANFAHAELIAWGAYVALAAAAPLAGLGGPIGPFTFGLPLILASFAAMAGTALLALAIDRLVFRPLRGRASHLTLVFASFGVALLVRNIILLIFGGQAQYYSSELQIAVELLPGMRVLPDQLFVLGFTLVVVALLHLFLQRTPVGLAMRAVAENPELARINGVDVGRVVRWTWGIGAALAALAGVLYGLTVQLRPEIGFFLLLPVFAAAIVGGVGSVFGAVAGGLFVGLMESFSVFLIPVGYKLSVPFVILLAVLFLRPRGLFGTEPAGERR